MAKKGNKVLHTFIGGLVVAGFVCVVIVIGSKALYRPQSTDLGSGYVLTKTGTTKFMIVKNNEDVVLHGELSSFHIAENRYCYGLFTDDMTKHWFFVIAQRKLLRTFDTEEEMRVELKNYVPKEKMNE